MNYANIKYFDISNGDGVRTSLFVSGCNHHCEGCFNSIAWDFNYGEEYTDDVKNKIIESIKPHYIQGISILGGEPLDEKNINTVESLIKEIKQNEELSEKTVWVYTGYEFEYILEKHPEILKYIDVLVDGKFILELKDLSLKFKGSSNQRIIDVQKSLKNRKVELYYE